MLVMDRQPAACMTDVHPVGEGAEIEYLLPRHVGHNIAYRVYHMIGIHSVYIMQAVVRPPPWLSAANHQPDVLIYTARDAEWNATTAQRDGAAVGLQPASF